jgi:DNA-binding transcriptional LysR family regulator
MKRVATELPRRGQLAERRGDYRAATPTLAATIMPTAVAEFGKLYSGIELRLVDVGPRVALK